MLETCRFFATKLRNHPQKTDVESLEDEDQDEKKAIKDEKLIYFYGPKDNLEHGKYYLLNRTLSNRFSKQKKLKTILW